jgi:uncharacterized cupin superfamily protein
MAHPNIVRSSELEAQSVATGQFDHSVRRLGAAAHATTLGVSLVEVPPGKTAWPYHFHSACEEGFYILEGEATIRIGAESIALRAGDYVASPPGPDHAHQLINTGTTPLRYLAMSAPSVYLGMDIVGYPDSNKLSFASGVKPGTVGWRDGAWVMKLIKSDTPNVGYFDDEPLAKK